MPSEVQGALRAAPTDEDITLIRDRALWWTMIMNLHRKTNRMRTIQQTLPLVIGIMSAEDGSNPQHKSPNDSLIIGCRRQANEIATV